MSWQPDPLRHQEPTHREVVAELAFRYRFWRRAFYVLLIINIVVILGNSR